MERAEIQRLFREAGDETDRKPEENVGGGTDVYPGRESIVDVANPTAPERQGALILTEAYLEGNVPKRTWIKVRNENALNFMYGSLERGAVGRQGRGLTELGKLFETMSRPPYNLEPRRGENVASFMRKVFTAVVQGDQRGVNTEEVKNFMRNARFLDDHK
jgi:hypothetical protein